jgi:hypothetical protein
VPTIRVTVHLTIDNDTVRGFPVQFVQVVDELQQFDYDEPADNNDTSFSTLPVQEVDSVQFLFVKALQAIGLRLEGGEAGNTAIRLSANGFLIVGNCTLTDSNITVNRNAATVARLEGLGGGT